MSKECAHEKYSATTRMQNLLDPETKTYRLYIFLTVKCSSCQKDYTFQARHVEKAGEPVLLNSDKEIKIPIDSPDKVTEFLNQVAPEMVH